MERDDSYVVLKNKEGSRFEYSLADGGVEKGEIAEYAAKREVLKELNINAEYLGSLGHIHNKSHCLRFVNKEKVI